MDRVVVTLDLPRRALSPNGRLHWMTRAKLVRGLRVAARLTACQELRCERPCWSRARLQATFFWPDRRRRDPDNAAAMLKPAIDGLVDAGLILDDSAEVLSHEPVVFAVDAERPRVELAVSALPLG